MNSKIRFSAGITGMALIILTLIAGPAAAGNDPSIKGALRTEIQNSMAEFIETNTVNGTYLVYDAVTGRMLSLELIKLHSGIVKKGRFYVSCADFKGADGKIYDLDFLVVEDGDRLLTTQAIVHSVDGKKRKYHVEN